MQRYILILLTVLSIWVFTSIIHVSVAQTQRGFERLVIFGDSLSDTGNLASATTDFPFPFFQNRISDGPVLVDYLATALGLQARASEDNAGNNFSVAGGNIVGSDREDLSSQINSFLTRGSGGAEANSASLYFLMMGGNDLRDIRSLNSIIEAQARINSVLDQFEAQLTRLYESGARTFLIANVANIGRIPETLARQNQDSDIAARAEAYSRLYNQGLAERLEDFKRKTGISLNVFDLFAELEALVENADALGFTQTEVGCFRLDSFRFESDCLFGTRFDRFIFFDSIHPTGKANQLASSGLVDAIPRPNIIQPRSPVSIGAIIQLLLLD